MARRRRAEDDFFFEDHNPFDWNPAAADILGNMPRYQSFMNDEMSQWLLDTAFFNEEISRADRAVARGWIREYFDEQWGYDIFEEFNWVLWRQEWGTP